MRFTTLAGRAAAAATTVLLAAACATESSTGPGAAGLGVTGYVGVPTQAITVCKAASSPAGTYAYTVAAPTGSVNPGDVMVPGNAFSLTLPPGASSDACMIVYSRSQAQVPDLDQPATIVVTEAAHPTSLLSAITIVSDGGLFTASDVPTRAATLSVNAYHSSHAVFASVPHVVQLGCTYTQGWYKNKGKATIAGRTLNGVAYLTLLNTPPGGSEYLILAHQYIAASMNAERGAYTPAPVADALADAAAYFAGTETFTRDEVIAMSATLDAFNNGLAPDGPPHCG